MTRVYEALIKSGETQTAAVLAAIDSEQAENARVLSRTDSAVAEVDSVVTAPAEEATTLAPPLELPDATPPQAFESEDCCPTAMPVSFTAYRRITIDLQSNPLLFPFEGADRATADQYRVLRTNLVHHPARPSLIVVSSASPGDGKTLTAVNTAGILAWKNEGDVLLIDADLRRRSVAAVLGIPEQPGFADVLQGQCGLDKAISNLSNIPKLHVMTAGTPSDNDPAELLDSARCREILTVVRGRFRYVIVDTAPIGILTDFDLVQACSDGVVVVVRPDHTNRKLLKEALSHLPSHAVLGVVLNGHQDWLFSKSPSSYAYGYGRR